MESPTSRSVVMTSSRMPSMPTWGGKYFALAVLFVMNTLNYVDRYAFSPLAPISAGLAHRRLSGSAGWGRRS